MLIALDENGVRTAASRTIPPGPGWRCPVCQQPVIHKPGRVKVAHFAHQPPTDCPAAHESLMHLTAKAMLQEAFVALGYPCDLELPLPDRSRRVDVAVQPAPGKLVAVEVQASPIADDELRGRERDHRTAGYFSTAWVFTASRCPEILGPYEVRIPKDLSYAYERTWRPLNVLDVASRQPYRVDLDRVYRHGESRSWFEEGGEEVYADYPGRWLRRTYTSEATAASWRLGCEKGRYATPGRPHWVVGFTC